MFKNTQSKNRYDNYIKSLKKVLKKLDQDEKYDIIKEINSHIYEALQNNQNKEELECLEDILNRLGSPDVVLRPIIAEKMLERSTKTFNPIHIFKALIFNLKYGISYIIFSFLYLILFSFLGLIIMKLVIPNKVGMYFLNGKFRLLGIVKSNANYNEVLGNWFIPVILLAMIFFYFLITISLRFKNKIK